MTSIEVTAPAKVNLFLKVLNRRKDSYHNILTLFERISLTDTIKISRIPKGIKISSDKLITKKAQDNLVYKAAAMILGHRNIGGVRISIKKNIPIAAGLGGGSSDAAATLIGINKLFDLKLEEGELMRLAGSLGADVSFFILNTPFAIGKDRGDKLQRLKSRVKLWHLLIYPNFYISTKSIYGALPRGLTRPESGDKIPLPLGKRPDFDGFETMMHNDLEDTVVSRKKIIGKIIERLALSLDKKAVVSGSGPSIFCLYRTRKEAQSAKKKFLMSVPARERKGWQVFVVGTY